jgi:KDO2-lipid IV(A) lauroyltransferase
VSDAASDPAGRPEPGLRARLAGTLVDAGYAAGWGAVRLLPEGLAIRLSDVVGDRVAGRDGPRVRQLRANLRVVTGGRLGEAELDELTRRAVRSYARYWREAFRLPVIPAARILRDTVFPGLEHMEKARADGRPLILALPHSGNWDAAGAWFAHWLGEPFMTVAERLEPESLYRRFLAYRESLGMRVVPQTGGPRPSSTVLREWLDGGGWVCLVADRAVGGGGVPVSFFGRPATMPAGPALLAAQTGAALHPAVCQFTEHGWRICVEPAVPVDGPGRLRDRVRAAMQGVADAFAEGIARQPEDWHMLGRIWSDVPGDPPRRAPGRGVS